ncbi:hypothetical protein AO287_21535 [Pseudomonas savastanoi]|uniref:EamA domain-containing protein n=2 Tax=Pseudomonas savastanoi TaxID=29438 RepID=A0AAW3LYQ9_PSESS|nr:hypothetical protein AO287_21535 [Pseudomonas savastanoi]
MLAVASFLSDCDALKMDEALGWFFKHLDQFTGLVAIATYSAHLAWNWGSQAKVQLALSKAISSSGIPNGVAFLLCAFFPEHVVKMQGAFVAFLLGGLALASITFLDIAKPKPTA